MDQPLVATNRGRAPMSDQVLIPITAIVAVVVPMLFILWLVALAPRDVEIHSGDLRNSAPVLPGLCVTYVAECLIAVRLRRLTPLAILIWTAVALEAFGFL